MAMSFMHCMAIYIAIDITACLFVLNHDIFIVHGFQIDLIDMSSIPDGDNRWIGHYKDHFSKYSILWAQNKKCAKETVENIERFVFAYLGVPRILQSDNGREFNNEVCFFHS